MENKIKINKIGNKKLPSILKDPFDKTSITNVNVSYRISIFDNWVASGTVAFKNGNTSGEQEFKGMDFDDVVSQIKLFIESLN